MRVTQQFYSYNDRRYGKPWIAKVTAWPIGQTPTLEWGSLVGLLAELDAEPGDVVRWGQKDHRGRRTEANWGIVDAEGIIAECTPTAARNHWLARAAGAPTEKPEASE